MTAPVRALLFGVGAIGAGIGRLAAERDDIVLVAAVDSAPDRAGKPLYDVLGVPARAGVERPVIEADAERALATARPQVVLHATGSYLPDVLPQLITCVRAGANVVSTCEELSYPWRPHTELAKQIDSEAKAHEVTVLGTGVNPGFVMDTLAVVLSGVCQRVERVRLSRVVDVSKRREQLQRKVGVGLTAEEFRAKGLRFGHVGLPQSVQLLADGLGWGRGRLALSLEMEPIAGPDGIGIGMRQRCKGNFEGRRVIEALIEMSTMADQPRDEIEIDGTPPVHMVIEGGIAGDYATAAIIVNAVPRVVAHTPGLITMLDLPPVAGKGVWS